MKRYFLCIAVIAFLLLSCSKTKQGDLLEVSIDIDQNSLIPLSEITEDITAIELELTDESLINPDFFWRIIVSESEVFIATLNKILVFNKDGKYIRSIGSQGQGPGEYTYIHNLALDEKNKRLFIISANHKIISYDLNGGFLKEKSLPGVEISDINYINEKLLLLVNKWSNENSKRVYSRSSVYRLNDDLRFVDSCTIRDLYVDGFMGIYGGYQHADFILKGTKSIYLYYGDFFERANFEDMVLCDTLYRFENNHLIPELKLKFKNDETGKFIKPTNIYRSSRYIFAAYKNRNDQNNYISCYDTKTGKGYNTQYFMDDINRIKDPVRIWPFNLDTEMFYYLHTNMKPDDLEEPNPTLYIGKLKK